MQYIQATKAKCNVKIPENIISNDIKSKGKITCFHYIRWKEPKKLLLRWVRKNSDRSFYNLSRVSAFISLVEGKVKIGLKGNL